MQILSDSVKATLNIGSKIAKGLNKGDIVCLFGELGAGKTILTKGMAAGLGVKKNAITSPSFVLIREYNKAKIPFFHFDLYHLKKPKDIIALGYEEYLYDDAVTVIEWADRLKYLLPKEYLKVELFIKPDAKRLLKLSGIGQYYKDLLKRIYENIRH